MWLLSENCFLRVVGTSWAEVESPSPEVGAIHVAVGMNVVWAVTKDNTVRNWHVCIDVCIDVFLCILNFKLFSDNVIIILTKV